MYVVLGKRHPGLCVHHWKEKTLKHTIEIMLLCLLAFASTTSAQETTEKATTGLGVRLGVALYQHRDEVLNNIRHRGPSVSAAVFLQRGSKVSMYCMGVSFGFASLKDRYSPDRSSILFNPAVEIRYARKALQVAERVAVFLGGTAGWNTRFAFYENWDQGHAYWLTSSQLGVGATLVRSMANGNVLQLDLDAPVLALVSRPPARFEYKEVNPSLSWVLKNIHQDSRLTSVHEYTELKATVAYGRALWGRRIFWQTTFVSARLPESRPFVSMSHKLGIVYPF
jgi:hypothetical protein